MTAITLSTPVTADGEFSFPALTPGTSFLFELSGDFGSGTATLGYVDAAGSFVAYKDGNGSDQTATAATGIVAMAPASGKPALSLTGSTGASITCVFTKTR